MKPRRRKPINLTGLLVVVAFVVAWQLFVTFVSQTQYIASPLDVVVSIGRLVAQGQLVDPILHTLRVVLAASVLAMVIGGALGAAIGTWAAVHDYSMGTIDILRSLPVVALMPVALLIWGPAEVSEIVVATVAGTWPVVVNTATAMKAAGPTLHEVATILRMNRWRRLVKIVLPAALPGFVVGARLGVIISLVVGITAEMLINPRGIGWQLVASQQALRPGDMWTWIVISALLGYVLNLVLMAISRRLVPGSSALARRVSA